MREKRNVFPVLLALFMVVYSGPSLAQQAPDWTLQTESGELVKLREMLGQPLLLHFWATWCPYCKRVQPGLNSLYNKYREQGFRVVAISFREDEGATPQAVLDERGVDFPTVIDGDEVAERYGVKTTPTNVFIDQTGKIISVVADSDPENPLFEEAVQSMLADSGP